MAVDSVFALRMEEYEAAVLTAVNNPKGGSVKFAGRTWRYLADFENGVLRIDDGRMLTAADGLAVIRYLDVTDSYKTLKTLMLILCGLYCALLVIFFVLARIFADRSIRPMTEAWESQRRFIADASHELKTPISTLNANLDIFYASQDDTIKEQAKWLDNSKKALSRMTDLIKSMLELAKTDESGGGRDVEDVCVNDLLESVGANSHVFSDYILIQQIVEILLANAVKYTNEGGEIRLAAYVEKHGVVITVKNSGRGISPADIDKIFERFYRGNKARVYAEGSYGLGLSIAQTAVKKIGASIDVQSDPVATCFTFANTEKSRTIIFLNIFIFFMP